MRVSRPQLSIVAGALGRLTKVSAPRVVTTGPIAGRDVIGGGLGRRWVEFALGLPSVRRILVLPRMNCRTPSALGSTCALFPPTLSSSLRRGCRPDPCRDGGERAENRAARRGHPVRGGHRASHRHGPERQAAVAAEAASRTLAEVGRRRRRVRVELSIALRLRRTDRGRRGPGKPRRGSRRRTTGGSLAPSR